MDNIPENLQSEFNFRFGGEPEKLSHCCGAVVHEFDICSDCKEHCELLEDEPDEE